MVKENLENKLEDSKNGIINKKGKKSKKRETISRIIEHEKRGRLLCETVYDYETNQLMFAVFPLDEDPETADFTYEPNVKDKNGILWIPPESWKAMFEFSEIKEPPLIRVPRRAEPYGSKLELHREIIDFFSDYAYLYQDVLNIMGWLIIYYAVWDHPTFQNTIYTVIRGYTGKGKSRVASLFRNTAYRTVNLGTGPTPALMYRISHHMKSLLMMDEMDWSRKNPKYEDMTTIWNMGFEKGGAQAILDRDKSGKWKPVEYSCYCPKFAVFTGRLPELATQSRCLIFKMPADETGFKKLWYKRLEDGMNTFQLDEDFFRRAESIRNKLLDFRARNWNSIKFSEEHIRPYYRQAASRTFQIISSLMSVIDDPKINQQIFKFAKSLELIRQQTEFPDEYLEILKVIYDKLTSEVKTSLKVGDIANEVLDRLSRDHNYPDYTLTPRKVGSILNNKLYIDTFRVGEGRVVSINLDEFRSICKGLGVYEQVFVDEVEEAKLKEEKKKEEASQVNLEDFI